MTLLWCSSKFAELYKLSLCNWRASEASETLLVVVQWKTRYVYTQIYVYVIARVGVIFGINFTSVRLSGNKIA